MDTHCKLIVIKFLPILTPTHSKGLTRCSSSFKVSQSLIKKWSHLDYTPVFSNSPWVFLSSLRFLSHIHSEE